MDNWLNYSCTDPHDLITLVLTASQMNYDGSSIARLRSFEVGYVPITQCLAFSKQHEFFVTISFGRAIKSEADAVTGKSMDAGQAGMDRAFDFVHLHRIFEYQPTQPQRQVR